MTPRQSQLEPPDADDDPLRWEDYADRDREPDLMCPSCRRKLVKCKRSPCRYRKFIQTAKAMS